MCLALPTSPGKAWLGQKGGGVGWLGLEQSGLPHRLLCPFRGIVGDMMQKLSVQLSDARNKGEFEDLVFGKFTSRPSPAKSDTLSAS